MKGTTVAKFIALGGVLVALFALLSLMPGAKPRSAQATANPLPPLIACPNVDASTDNKITVADILTIVQHYNKSYGQAGYEYLWDAVTPYNSTSPANTGLISVADILYVVQHYGLMCSQMETQIATATRAIADPTFMSTLCDPTYASAVNCGGDPQFLTENVSFLTGKGYRRGSSDVPGQGIHYVNFNLWNGTFNPARPPGLVYKGGVLVAQLYYGAGDSNATIGGTAGIGWGPNQSSDTRGVNIDAFCTPVAQEPPGTGCSWGGSNDGFHWHSNLCTVHIGTTSALAIPGLSQSDCTSFGGGSCTWYPAANWNCTWAPAVGWMGHLWNWLPNANYTLGASPGPTCVHCLTGENNGRFADCFPDGGSWTAYNCPQ